MKSQVPSGNHVFRDGDLPQSHHVHERGGEGAIDVTAPVDRHAAVAGAPAGRAGDLFAGLQHHRYFHAGRAGHDTAGVQARNVPDVGDVVERVNDVDAIDQVVCPVHKPVQDVNGDVERAFARVAVTPPPRVDRLADVPRQPLEPAGDVIPPVDHPTNRGVRDVLYQAGYPVPHVGGDVPEPLRAGDQEHDGRGEQANGDDQWVRRNEVHRRGQATLHERCSVSEGRQEVVGEAGRQVTDAHTQRQQAFLCGQ